MKTFNTLARLTLALVLVAPNGTPGAISRSG